MIFLSILTGLTSMIPILIIGMEGIFYSIDPEVMYVGNALSYIKLGQIQYVDHPGTPSILLFGFLLWPLRIYAKLVDHVPFILWAFKHYSVMFLYLRIWQGTIFTLGVWIFLKTVKSTTNSWIMVLLSWILLLIYPPFLRLGTGITPETLSFLLSAIWIRVLSKYLLKPDVGIIPVLGVVSGLAVANKFTNLFLAMASILLPISLKALTRHQKGVNALILLLLVSAGFVTGTWAIRDKYHILFGWAVKLVTSTGIHAGGPKGIFDWSSYWQSVLAVHHQLPWLYIGIATILILSIIQRRLVMLVIIFTIGVLAFAKYPLSYYQLTNYIVLVFLLAFLLARIDKAVVVVICLSLLPLVRSTVDDYLKTISLSMNRTKALGAYVRNNPPRKFTLWEWGRAKDPALLLTTSPDWHGSIFEAERRSLNLPIRDLSSIPSEKLFDLCWDQLYIQELSLKWFVDKYPEKLFKKTKIPGNDEIVLLTSGHCPN